MEIALLIDQAKPVNGFDYCFYEARQVTGKKRKSSERMFNVIVCFADNIAVRGYPDWVAVSAKGKRSKIESEFRVVLGLDLPYK